MVFLSHFTASGINDILELDTDMYYMAMDAALEQYTAERETPIRVVLAGIEEK